MSTTSHSPRDVDAGGGDANSGGGGARKHWKFSQVFGPVDEVNEVDVVSALEFDRTGEYLAVGDRGGRIVLFNTTGEKNGTAEYKFYSEFQSHESEFDYLKSLEIEEKINKIRWCPTATASKLLLTTNDKTVKLWRVCEKRPKRFAVASGTAVNEQRSAELASDESSDARRLRVPRVDARGTASSEAVVSATTRKTFANAHQYHINSLALNSDGEHFASADDLRINFWNLGNDKEGFNIVDIKPENMDELSEVITAAEFHPHACNLLAYATSKGTLKLADMREQALCDQSAKLYDAGGGGGGAHDDEGSSFFSEIISSISDVKFSNDGRYMVARDYMTLKVWDLNMEKRPLKTLPVHPHIRQRLCDLYEIDSIFDKFELTVSRENNMITTGSYGNLFTTFDIDSSHTYHLEANPSTKNSAFGVSTRVDVPDQLNLNKKLLHLAWHPQSDVCAVAGDNNLFIYHARDPPPSVR